MPWNRDDTCFIINAVLIVILFIWCGVLTLWVGRYAPERPETGVEPEPGGRDVPPLDDTGRPVARETSCMRMPPDPCGYDDVYYLDRND